MTPQAFYLVANLCKVTSVPELVSIISKRRRIPKESVISDCGSCPALSRCSSFLIATYSEQEGTRSGCGRNVAGPVAKMPVVIHAIGRTMSKHGLHSHSML